jgi:hypothetical protein
MHKDLFLLSLNLAYDDQTPKASKMVFFGANPVIVVDWFHSFEGYLFVVPKKCF